MRVRVVLELPFESEDEAQAFAKLESLAVAERLLEDNWFQASEATVVSYELIEDDDDY